MNDELEGSGLDLFQVKSRFLWVSVLRSQCPVCRASICRMNDVLEESGLELFQEKVPVTVGQFAPLKVSSVHRVHM
jgi:hypothetical protein